MKIDLSGKKLQRRLQVLRMAMLACEEAGGKNVDFSILLRHTLQYGAYLVPRLKESEAKSGLTMILLHLMLQ